MNKLTFGQEYKLLLPKVNPFCGVRHLERRLAPPGTITNFRKRSWGVRQ